VGGLQVVVVQEVTKVEGILQAALEAGVVDEQVDYLQELLVLQTQVVVQAGVALVDMEILEAERQEVQE